MRLQISGWTLHRQQFGERQMLPDVGDFRVVTVGHGWHSTWSQLAGRQPGSKLVLGGVPHRTSYELHLPAEMSAWYSSIDFQRTLSGRIEELV